jgi:hypothetical protein
MKHHLINAMIRFGAAIFLCIVFAVYDFLTGNMTGGLLMTGVMAIWIVFAYLLYRYDKKSGL